MRRPLPAPAQEIQSVVGNGNNKEQRAGRGRGSVAVLLSRCRNDNQMPVCPSALGCRVLFATAIGEASTSHTMIPKGPSNSQYSVRLYFRSPNIYNVPTILVVRPFGDTEVQHPQNRRTARWASFSGLGLKGLLNFTTLGFIIGDLNLGGSRVRSKPGLRSLGV